MTQPGFKTTEFWLSFAAMVIGAILASGVLDSTATNVDNQIVGLLVTVLTALGYTAARGFVKNSEMKAATLIATAEAKPSDPT